MRRRDLLATLGTAGLVSGAGCITVWATDPDVRRRTVSLSSVDDIATEHRVSIDVGLLEENVTDEHTARLRVTTTNEGEPRRLSVGDRMCAIFNREGEMSDPEGVWLYRPEETQWLEREGPRWEHDGNPNSERAYAAYGCLPRKYETGESVATDYLLWDDFRVDGYLPPATYRWEVPIRVWNDREGGYSDAPVAAFTWGFSLSIDVPEPSATPDETDST
jgi:hypothetical protein